MLQNIIHEIRHQTNGGGIDSPSFQGTGSSSSNTYNQVGCSFEDCV